MRLSRCNSGADGVGLRAVVRMGEEATASRREVVCRPSPSWLVWTRGEGADVTDDERYMQMALDLAADAEFPSPNPRVGAVIVRDGRVLASGVHRGPGHPHAEATAIQGIDAAGATCYVNLEPCLHQGLTPPCAPALVAAGIARVVAAVEDPDPRVRGAGLAYLREHGLDVELGVLADVARSLNAPYLHHRSTGRAFVTLKLALTLDARLNVAGQRWITGLDARRFVHLRRAQADAVMVGAGTVAADNPRLTARDVVAPRQPLRIVVDSSGRSRPSAAVFDDAAETLVATTDRAPHDALIAWKEAGAEVVSVGADDHGAVDLEDLLVRLGDRGILEVYCEGGRRLASSLLERGLVNRLELHYAPIVGGSGPVFSVGSGPPAASEWRTVAVEKAGPDVLVTLEPA